MVKKRIAIMVVALLIFSILPGLALGAGVSLDLSKSSAAIGDSITTSGSTGPNEWVSIKVVDSSGSIVVFDLIKSNSSGDYSYSFKIPRVSPGNLTVVAGCGSNVDNKTLLVSGGGSASLSSIGITKSAAKVIYTVGESLDISGLEVTGYYNDDSSRVEDITPANISGFDSSKAVAQQTLIIRVANKTATYIVTISEPVTAAENGTISITNIPLIITLPKDTINTGIEFPQNSPLPPVKIESDQVEMTISNGTTVSGSDTIQLPEVKPSSSVDVAGAQSVDLVIEVGSNTNAITFNKPVRLVLKGQGKRSAGFIDNDGEFHTISKPEFLNGFISDGDVDAVTKLFEEKEMQEGAVDYRQDLIIWTKHFTQFIAYTPPGDTGPGGPGEQSLDVIPLPGFGDFSEYDEVTRSQVISSRGGIIKIEDIMLIFPANAVSEDIKVTIKKMRKDKIPSVSSRFKLLGTAYEITTDKKDIEFKKPVTITLSFDQDEVDKEKYDVGIYSCGSDERWEILDQVKANLDSGKASGSVNHFSIFAVFRTEKGEIAVVEEQPVQDVLTPVKSGLNDIANHWAEQFISQLVEMGAVSGYPDGTFKPDNTITRAEFATMLVKAFKIKPERGNIFSDTREHWAEDGISAAAAHGIVSGYNEATFGPDDLITREQMAVMISKAANLNGGEGKIFADNAQIADWAVDAVAATTSKNIISGYPDNTFRPKAHATRAEAVTVIVKAFNTEGH